MASPAIDEELVRKINEALITSGERDRLKMLVREKLTKAEEARARNVDSITPQELASVLYPKATELVPTHVKKELEQEIRQFLDTHIRLA